MTWKRDTRPENVRQIGAFSIFSEVNSDRETAHVVQFPDGREIRVLPDDRSGAARSQMVRRAVEYLESFSDRLGSPDALLVVFRGLADEYRLTWHGVSPDLSVSIEEWLTEWFSESEPRRSVDLLHDLEADGWQITRKGEE